MIVNSEALYLSSLIRPGIGIRQGSTESNENSNPETYCLISSGRSFWTKASAHTLTFAHTS